MPEQVSIPAALSEVPPLMRPIAAKARIEILDVLRGFAIFGILLVTMTGFSGSEYADWWTGTADRVAQNLIFYLARAKFVTIFSFLFGLGFALQLLRVLPPL